ncbi:Acyl-CoA synthetase (AMP-forming)/AMP-acid ligase II [Micromonospora pallida]|uniref:Acyl-CoA synthetase (AMP-forming)/AMP-acid ligase II n=1 Tax=Micromonospora pallida TaxID=145854 RepID=A0A1C6S0Y9_9ACTN|nr:non-ribosomal peptide synthetase [Micromonospora pallida]SCL23137.1 Acyl-CoA synthetase (AMP-forming)/AMP-acid ligase II [Micromonospora pallida]
MTGGGRDRGDGAGTTSATGPGLLARVAAHADRTPRAVAVRAAAGCLEYGDLVARAGAIAGVLRGRGVVAESPVGICLPRSPELVAALLGVLWAGGTAVPLDPAAARMRLRLQALDAGLVTVLVTAATVECAAFDVPVTMVDAMPATPVALPPPDWPADRAAVVVHSAGVEEEPRPVVVTHGNLAGLVDWLVDGWPTGTFAGVRVDAPLDGHLALCQFLAPLAVGGTALVDGDAVLVDGDAALMDAAGATAVGSTSTAAAPSVRIGLPAPVGEASPVGDTTALLVTGGPVTGPVPSAVTCWSAWGAAETGGPVLAGTHRTDDPWALGAARADTTPYVLDDALRPVATGVVGRLHLGGGAVTRGYHGQPSLTAERYLPDPFAATPGQRMVATDDLVRRDADGVLRWVGRLDDCSRRDGEPAPPVEAQAALRRHPGIADAAVVGSPTGELVAAVVPASGELVAAEVPAPGTAGLRSDLAGLLPARLRPDRVLVLDALPLLPSGKVNRRALLGAAARAERVDRAAQTGRAAQDEPTRQAGRDEQAGRTDRDRPAADGPGRAAQASGAAERAVAEAWTTVLRRRVEADRNFFDAGGDSLLMIRLSGLLRRAFDREVDVVDLFRLPTIRDMAAHLSTPLVAPTPTDPPAPDGLTAAERQAQARQEARRQMGRARGARRGA